MLTYWHPHDSGSLSRSQAIGSLTIPQGTRESSAIVTMRIRQTLLLKRCVDTRNSQIPPRFLQHRKLTNPNSGQGPNFAPNVAVHQSTAATRESEAPKRSVNARAVLFLLLIHDRKTQYCTTASNPSRSRMDVNPSANYTDSNEI